MRALKEQILVSGLALCLYASLAGCAAQAQMATNDAVGRSLTLVADQVLEASTLLIQDVSPRVGVPASFSDAAGYDEWVVVAACADAADLRSASTVEVAVIPQVSYTTGVRSAVRHDEFVDAVSCDGRAFR